MVSTSACMGGATRVWTEARRQWARDLVPHLGDDGLREALRSYMAATLSGMKEPPPKEQVDFAKNPFTDRARPTHAACADPLGARGVARRS